MLLAVLLGGWMLMLPPSEKKVDGTRHLNADAPIERWVHWQSFDRAQQCERARSDSAQRLAQDKLDTSRDFVAARCVPAEHIYPPAKASP
jgi:hypothetical protein